MKLTNKQIIDVGKDRAIDELIDIVNTNHGFLNLNESQRERIKTIGKLISLPKTLVGSIKLLKENGFISGDEHIFYNKSHC